LKRLSDLGDQFEAFRGAVNFEIFRSDLTVVLAYSDGVQHGDDARAGQTEATDVIDDGECGIRARCVHNEADR